MTLCLEAVNRFECYFLNTHADLARFAKAVNHPNCRVMYDTFHSHIEEKDTVKAIRAARTCWRTCTFRRTTAARRATGNVRWKKTFDTLHEVGYDGWLMIEAFGLALPELVAATKIWRRMYESEDQLARDGLAFMKSQVAERW